MATKRGQKPGEGAVASNGKAPAPSPANAWARPLKTSGPPPGMGPADKARAPSSGNKPSTPTDNNNNNKPNGASLPVIHRERLLHLSLTLIGQKVVATLTDGAVLEGVFHTFTPFDSLEADVKNKYVLNTVKVVKAGKDNSIEAGSKVILAVDKVVQLYAKNINLDRPNKSFAGKGASHEFETDTQISGTRAGGNRDLVAAGSAWTSAPGGGKQTRAEALAGALGTDPKGRKGNGGPAKDTSGLKGNIGGWDQFKANEELFNVNASFDENLYTTELDKSQIDSRKIKEAERIAREIETTTSSNIHIAEERGQALETDYDEEDRYSGVLTKEGKQRHEAQPDKTAPAGAPKKIMNYAAAAAKADASKKAAPPSVAGKAPATAAETKSPEGAAKVPSEAAPVPAPKAEEKTAEASKDSEPADEKKDETKTANESASADKKTEEEKTDEKPKTSKLNANAKSFTFNPSAKSFTPSFGTGGGGFVPQQQPQQMPDPNMQMHAGGHPMQPPHYMHAQMGQPGMMPMMSPQYPGMRYPPQFAGMDQQGVPQQMQGQQPQHMQPGTGAPGAPQPTAVAPSSQGGPAAPPTGGDASTDSAGPSSQEGEPSQPAAPGQQGPQSQQQQPHHHQQQQQQPMPMPYNVPPQGAYFAGGAMGMHPRGPGGYPPQFVGGPQQIPVGPQGAPYRQMYPMQPGGMPPNMHMRGPGGAPYYAGPNGPMPYPPGAYGHGMMDDGDGGFRGRGGRGPGRGRGGRGRRGGGRGPGGRGQYQNNHHQHQQQPPYGGPNSGLSTPQPQHDGALDQGAPNVPQGQPQEGEKPNEGIVPEGSS